MNWYKISSAAGYLSIGQDPTPEDPVFLWWWDGSLHVEKTESIRWGHQEAIPNWNNVICRGRYDPKTNTLSVMSMNGFPEQALNAIKAQWPNASIRMFRQ